LDDPHKKGAGAENLNEILEIAFQNRFGFCRKMSGLFPWIHISGLTSLTWLVRNAGLLATEDMPRSNSHGQRKIGYKTKVLRDGRLEVRRKK
jgi:hypothetical protein